MTLFTEAERLAQLPDLPQANHSMHALTGYTADQMRSCALAAADAREAAVMERLSKQEPAAWRLRYRSEPGMIGYYPWSYMDTFPKRAGDPKFEVEPLYTHPAPVAQSAQSSHIKEPYTPAEIKAKIASNDYSAELLLQHAMLLLDGDALTPTERAACEQCGSDPHKMDCSLGSKPQPRLISRMETTTPQEAGQPGATGK